MTDPESRLRAAGVRVTPQRLALTAVLDRARAEESHLSAAEVLERTQEILGRVSRQAVYDGLETLVRAGLAHRVGLPGMVARYESAAGEPHHHVACGVCGMLGNAPCAVPTAGCLEETGGHAGTHTEVVHVTTCRHCAQGSHETRRTQRV